MTIVANDTGGAVSQWLVGPLRRSGSAVWCSPRATRRELPAEGGGLPEAHVARRAGVLAADAGDAAASALQRLPIAYGWATHDPIEPRIMDSYLGDLRTNAGVRRDFAGCCGRPTGARCCRRPRRWRPSAGLRDGESLFQWSLCGAEFRFHRRLRAEKIGLKTRRLIFSHSSSRTSSVLRNASLM